MLRALVMLVVFLSASPALAQLKHVEVTENIHALIGPLGDRNMGNLGNNATFGVVVTAAGLVLVDPGGSYAGAQMIDKAIQKFSDQPVKIVINSGGQDHRWLGNSYWIEKGADIIASAAAVADQKDRQSIQMTMLSEALAPIGLGKTVPSHASKTFDDSLSFDFGGVHFDLVHAAAHTPGDIFVSVPSESTVFAGDIIYMERLLGVIPVSSSQDWIASFKAIEELDPDHIIPGHGKPTNILDASTDTYDYLINLREQIGEHIENGGTIMNISQIDQSAFSHLQNFDILSGRNAQAVFEEMEWE